MCTAISFLSGDHYFGRNLDYEFSYCEEITVTPRNFPFRFRFAEKCESHPSMIGMAFVRNDYPLYYDATSECGLSVAGLNFPDNAFYAPSNSDAKLKIASFEFIPYVLCHAATTSEAKKLLDGVAIVDEAFNNELPPSPLHWIISDKNSSIVVEPTREGVKIYDNPVGVLTNNPTFDYHLTNLTNYMSLTKGDPANTFAENLELKPYSRGMGGLGLPGDLSSASRFIKATFTKMNALPAETEAESVAQFLRILGSVEQQKGCCLVKNGYEYTIYSSCCNTDKGIYYYTTYSRLRPTGVDMHAENLDGEKLYRYPIVKVEEPQIINASK